MSWLLHRVDDRLIHGQILVAWGQRMHPARIWVADDAVAANAWERELLSSAAPDVEVRIVTVTEMAAAWAGENDAEGGAFLLVRNLETALALVEAGAPIARFNVGGLHYLPGKTKVNEYVYLDDADRARARTLLGRGVSLEVQDVPAARPEPLASLDPASAPA
ncbi:MAG TPA: PTS sugar transporter subunit IIB [Candidatus Eisenbacteria bacterium]|nr:PTS sugar transporter subunit IIB [Candidatus Eisenbacteria bacterium]